MSFGRAQDAERPADSSAVLPSTSPTPRRSDAAILADELAKSAEQINWPHLPGPGEFGQMAEMILSAGYYPSEELADASSAERAQIYKILAGERESYRSSATSLQGGNGREGESWGNVPSEGELPGPS